MQKGDSSTLAPSTLTIVSGVNIMILGFAGKAATGKTTAAKHIEPLLDKECKIVPMAMVLRDEVEAFLRAIGADESVPLVYGCQNDKVRVFYVDEGKALEQCPKWSHFIAEHAEIQDKSGLTAVTVRRILQWWGTEYRRAEDPDYWTKAWGRKISEHAVDKMYVLVDDVRFINELNVIKEHGGLIAKIERPGFDGANNHASETSLDDYDDWDGKILNDGTLAEFGTKVEVLVAELIKE
jgi:hypothetical protein